MRAVRPYENPYFRSRAALPPHGLPSYLPARPDAERDVDGLPVWDAEQAARPGTCGSASPLHDPGGSRHGHAAR
jgi:hypothetical protein